MQKECLLPFFFFKINPESNPKIHYLLIRCNVYFLRTVLNFLKVKISWLFCDTDFTKILIHRRQLVLLDFTPGEYITIEIWKKKKVKLHLFQKSIIWLIDLVLHFVSIVPNWLESNIQRFNESITFSVEYLHVSETFLYSSLPRNILQQIFIWAFLPKVWKFALNVKDQVTNS